MDKKTLDEYKNASNKTESGKNSGEQDAIISFESDQTEVLLAHQEISVDSLSANPNKSKSAEISTVTAATTNETAATLSESELVDNTPLPEETTVSTKPDTEIESEFDSLSTITADEPTESLGTASSGQIQSKRKTYLILGSIVGVLAIALVVFLL
ncbi:hypothetical protein [Acetobacterium wieringae]|uniref:hypothetical protein n=1 Tax=Acetobacterium wieringae TaxID=52694 RepID=UPI003158E6BB